MVSTATAKPGSKAVLFKRLLNFEVGSSNFEVRNIDDVYFGRKTHLLSAVELMGGGGIVYCSSSEEAKQVLESLSSNGVRAGFVGGGAKRTSTLSAVVSSTCWSGQRTITVFWLGALISLRELGTPFLWGTLLPR